MNIFSQGLMLTILLQLYLPISIIREIVPGLRCSNDSAFIKVKIIKDKIILTFLFLGSNFDPPF